MKDPDWFVRSLFPPKRRLPPRAVTSNRPSPLSPRSGVTRRPPKRPPLPRSPFHP